MDKKIDKFIDFRKKMNEIILEEGDLNTKRFFNLDTKIYQAGKLETKTKELLGLVASMVLRCDDCITYHILESYKEGWSKKEIYEAMNVALIVGGSIVIPHMRRAAELLEKIDTENFEKESVKLEIESELNEKKYTIYTDGACLGNPGAGGYAAIVLNKDGKKLTEISGSEIETTNNRMELKAVIEALKIVPKNSQIELYSDSSYVLNGLSIWIKNWKKNNWQTSSKKEVANRDLWEELDALAANNNLIYKKVKGHSGDHFNEEVDNLAKKEAEKV